MSGPSGAARRLIVNADDFGLSPAISRGIVEAYRAGTLTSTTMLVNTPHFADAARLAVENPGLSVGVHLTLLWGPPVSPASEVPTLVDGNGCFPDSAATLACRNALGRLSGDDVQTEFLRQIERFRDAGLEPSHVDTHKHVHALPRVREALIRAAAAAGIRRVRLPVERPEALPGVPPGSARGRAKRRILAVLCRGHRARFAAAGLRTTDRFVGVSQMDGLNGEVFRFIFGNVPSGTTELMCHPGRLDEPARRYGSRSPDRERELAGLLDRSTREAAERAGVELIGWREI